MKNIAFAKIGKSIKFKTAYSPTGGDNEPIGLLKALANNNPDCTYYIVGRSDFRKLSDSEKIHIFPYNNVIDCYEKHSGSMEDNYDFLIRYFSDNKINIDFGVMMIGQIGTVTIPGKIEQVKDRSLTASVIDMTKNYSTPTIWWLNETMIPWIEIINDPRYDSAQSRDFINTPIASLSQFDYTYTHNKIKSYEDQDREEVTRKATYNQMETLFCVSQNYPRDIREIHKDIGFTIVLNEGKPSRYSMLKEWVLGDMEDVEIYGQWEESTVGTDSRFKGTRQLSEVQRIMSRTKYTFIIPIADGWVTSKYIEMIHAGCIPFFHPSYDRQNHLNIPDVLRMKKPIDLYNFIDYLEKYPDERLRLLKLLQDGVLKRGYYDGTIVNKEIMSVAYDKLHNQKYESPDLSQFNKEETFSLDNFF